MKSDFIIALTQLAAERNLPREVVLSAIEVALISAYRKDGVATGQNISVKLEPGTGDISVYVLKSVVEEVEEPQTQITLEDARKIKPDAEIGESIPTGSLPHSAGRIAAQTARQVVMQRLREAERELVFEEFADKEGEVFTVNIQRVEPKQIIVDLGRGEAILPISQQSPYERARPGMKMRVLLQSVQRSGKGPELIVSRTDDLLVKRLFEMEVPEIFNGAVEIVTIAREPGSRSKVAVRAKQDRVDPVGSCVGLRGVRIQNIVNELHGEKIDVVEWSKDPHKYLANALSPSQVMRVELDTETGSAIAIVPERQISLAIGKEGQNARLAAKLTGWNVDIRSHVEAEAAVAPSVPAEGLEEPVDRAQADLEYLSLSTRGLNCLKNAGITKVAQVLEMTKDDLLGVKGFGEKSYNELYGRLHELSLLPLEPGVEAELAVEEVEAPAEEAVAEPEVEKAKEETVEAPTAEAVEPAPSVEEVTPEIPKPEEAAERVPEEQLVAELEKAVEVPAVPVIERAASLRDVSADVWSIRRSTGAQPGQIRFAEDIEGLRGGVTARRSRTRDGSQTGRKRRPKARSRRFQRR